MKIVALDVGEKRIGVAKADTSVRIAIPDGTIVVNGQEFDEIAKILKKYRTDYVVLGLPRNSKGLETAQSAYVRDFSKKLKQHVPTAKIRFQDESLTSVEAERRLKARKGLNYAKGEVDTEAATIILQDFIENFSSTVAKNEPAPEEEPSEKEAKKKSPKHKKLIVTLISIFAVLLVAAGGAFVWYNIELSAPVASTDSEEFVTFKVKRGDTTAKIAENLEKEGLVKSSLAFQIYYRLHYANDSLKVGEYKLKRSMSTPDVAKALVEGENESNVFKLTILPGETVADVKAKLVKDFGYDQKEVDAAFSKKYDHEVLKGRENTSEYGAEPLEGYLFGDTYEFYKGESVEKIIETCLDALWTVVQAHNLEEKFAAQGLSLYQGITLASIVQKESNSLEQPKVAKVFLNRLARGLHLGSDVTTQYALDLADPERKTYTNNADALKIDSDYNTRLHVGLTPGPISNPGLSALLGVAEPTDTDALYFLTGDDGMMYYSNTEQGHIQNIRDHCRELCSVSL